MRSCRAALLGTALSFAGLGAATAQIEPIDPEADRLGPYGVQTGAFVMTPEIYAGVRYDDNVLARDAGAEDDFATEIEATTTFASIWRRHALGFGLTVDAAGYNELKSENRFDFRGEVDGRIDLTEANQLFANASAGRFTEERGSANLNLDALSPIEYGQAEAELGATHRGGRSAFSVSTFARTLDFDDVGSSSGVIDNDVRDYDVYGLTVDVGSEFRAGYEIFFRGETDRREYEEAASSGRDSTGVEGRLGVRADITDLIVGEAYLGYLARDYDAFSAVDGLSFGADVSWTPTALWRVVVAGSQSVEETNDATASSFTSTQVELSAQRSVLRRLSLGPTIGYRRNDFAGSTREEDILTLGLQGRYDLNRTVSILAGLGRTERDSTLLGGDYEQDRVTLGFTLRR